jgi:hypothetical protein
VHKINPDIHLTSEIYVTLKLFTAALTHISSRIRRISVRADCFMPTRLHKNIYVRMLCSERKNEVREFRLYLISTCVCALAEMFCPPRI